MKNEKEIIMRINDFINNLTNNDIDLIDKLDNLSSQISEYAYELMEEEENFENANEYIKEILRGEAMEDLTEEYIDFIVEETNNLYEEGLCEKDEFSAGLYNCDELYLLVIADVLDCDVDDLEDLEEGYGRLTI
jgi:hypothetical protein